MRRTSLACVVVLAVSACHAPNRLYNAANPKAKGGGDRSIVRVEVPSESGARDLRQAGRKDEGIRIDAPDPRCDPADQVCMAFVEFDEQGELWDRQQPERALALIERAKGAGRASGREPIILTFTHGWKNNAADGPQQNHNVVGFEKVLTYLRDKTYRGHPVVGVYLGWRGDLVPEFWPIRRQLSYFDREGAAIRIPGASMTALLTRIMIEGHRDDPGAQVMFIGHSFGALALERALTQAMTDYVLRQTSKVDGNAPAAGDAARADLVVFVNSAAAASEAKQMLNVLKDVCYEPGPAPCAAAGSAAAARPLFLSISSLGDAATRFAMPIGHGLSFLNFKQKGSWRDYRDFADDPAPPSITAQSAYYMSTTAHMDVLQSHMIVDPNDPTSVKRCAVDAAQQPRYVGGAITTVTAETYRVCEKEGRWNDTPYWVMQMPASIVPDHSGIFNVNFVDLLTDVFLSRHAVETPELQPQLKRRARE